MKTPEQYALITGGTSGVAYQLACQLAADGYNLIIMGKNQLELNTASHRLTSQFNIKVTALPIEKFDAKIARDIHEMIAGYGNRIDLVVNDADFNNTGIAIAHLLEGTGATSMFSVSDNTQQLHSSLDAA